MRGLRTKASSYEDMWSKDLHSDPCHHIVKCVIWKIVQLINFHLCVVQKIFFTDTGSFLKRTKPRFLLLLKLVVIIAFAQNLSEIQPWPITVLVGSFSGGSGLSYGVKESK